MESRWSGGMWFNRSEISQTYIPKGSKPNYNRKEKSEIECKMCLWDAEQTCGHSGGRKVWLVERVALKHTHYHMWNIQPLGICCMKQGAQPSTLWQPREEGWG